MRAAALDLTLPSLLQDIIFIMLFLLYESYDKIVRTGVMLEQGGVKEKNRPAGGGREGEKRKGSHADLFQFGIGS